MSEKNENNDFVNEDQKINELSAKIQKQKNELVELDEIVNQLKDEILHHNKNSLFSVYLPHIFVFFCIIVLIAKSYKTIL